MGGRPRRRSGVSWLALGYFALVGYASLYPFAPWEWPAGLSGWDIVRLDWPRYWSEFDVWANASGYVPLGVLIFAAAWRSGVTDWRCAGLALLLLPSAAALGLEVAQRFVALRVPSLADWALNSAGATFGTLLGALAARMGWLERWGQWRERWFEPQASSALALLALWPLGLLFPMPAPLAQGQFLPAMLDALEGVLRQAGEMLPLHMGGQTRPIDHLLATFLGLLAPCLLMVAVSRPGLKRGALVLGVGLVGVGMSALSAALSFGPANAWAWLNRDNALALALALAVSLLATLAPGRVSAVLAVPVLTGLILLVARMDPDPYVQLNRQRWEHAPHVRLYGLLQWLGRLWPLLALGWVMTGLARGVEPKIDASVRSQRR